MKIDGPSRAASASSASSSSPASRWETGERAARWIHQPLLVGLCARRRRRRRRFATTSMGQVNCCVNFQFFSRRKSEPSAAHMHLVRAFVSSRNAQRSTIKQRESVHSRYLLLLLPRLARPTVTGTHDTRSARGEPRRAKTTPSKNCQLSLFSSPPLRWRAQFATGH